MSVATVQLNCGKSVKLGRQRPKARPQCLAFGHYLKRFEGAAEPPPAVDYSAKAMAALKQMYGNDQWGDCVIAGKLHQLGIWSGNDSDSGGTVVGTTQEAVQQYHAICGPGDNGCNITDVLDVFKAKGLQAGGKVFKIDGYVSVDWTNKLEVQVALYLFGSLTLGINLPQAWLNAPEGGLWDVTNSQIVGGHDVCAVGYNETGVVIATWGGLRTITWAAFADPRWLEECYAQLAPLWYGNDKLAPCGVAVATLQADLAKLGGGVIPDIGPTPDPVPPVPPSPPSPPSPPVPGPLVVSGIAKGMISGRADRHGNFSISVALPVTGTAQPASAAVAADVEADIFADLCDTPYIVRAEAEAPQTPLELAAKLESLGLPSEAASDVGNLVFSYAGTGQFLRCWFGSHHLIERAALRNHGSINPANLAAILQFLLSILPLILPLIVGG